MGISDIRRQQFKLKKIDIDKIEQKTKQIIDSVIEDDYSIAEIEVLLRCLTNTSKQLKYRKSGKFTYEVEY